MSGTKFPDEPPIAANLRAELARTRLTIDEVARQLEVSERQVRRWRNGETTPSWPSLCGLARVFDRDPSFFYAANAAEPQEAAA